MQTLTGIDKSIPIHPNRKHIYNKFYKLLYNYIHLDTSLRYLDEEHIKKMSINIERGIFNHALTLYNKASPNDTWNDLFKSIYINRCIIIYDNLNPNGKIGNTKLLTRLLQKEFDEFKLCSLSPKELFPEKWEQTLNLLSNSKDYDPIYIPQPKLEDRPDGAFKCKCGSFKTEYTEVQTRSADEPTTKKVYCWKCGNRWKFC
jgi:DNA-directed RNA polymerase subunit M/transcription elongation factor TFIIS